MTDEPEAESRTPRDELRDGLSSALTTSQVAFLIDEVLAIRKSAWASCPGCKKRVAVEVADAKSVAGALKDLLAEGFGRPRGDEVEQDRIVFTRTVVFEGDAPDP